MRQTLKLVFGILLVAGALSGCHRSYDEQLNSPPTRATALPLGEDQPAGVNGAMPGIPAKEGGDSGRPAVPKFEVPAESALPYKHSEVQIDATHVYSLPELIDLAQRSNPTTRIAWERARQAALAVGLIEATYLPEISAEVLGGSQHITLPVPRAMIPEGSLDVDTNEVVPALVLKWLLFDFGRRQAMSESARQIAKAAYTGFTGAHQKLIFEVSKGYFALDAERAQLRVAESALKSARVLEEAAQAKFNQGLATVVEVSTAKRGTAKALYDLEQAKAVDNDAYHALMESMGLNPTLKLNIASSAGRQLPRRLSDDVDSSIQRALVRRLDIVAALAKVRASEAGVKAARAAYLPTVGVEGLAGWNIGGISVDGGPYATVDKPTYGFLFNVKLPLFDGGTRGKNLSIAHSQETAAKEELFKAQDEAIRQVAHAHDTMNSALAQFEAAGAFVEAADTEAESSLEAYKHGVTTFTVAETAETNRVQAQAAKARAYAGVLTAAATLAFTTGELTSSQVLEHPQ